MTGDSLLKSIRPIAEMYVKTHLPDEYPFFRTIWTQSVKMLSSATVPSRSKDVAAWLSTPALAFSKTHTMSLVTPAVILVLEATARQLGAEVSAPEENQVCKAIAACAKAFGVQKDRAEDMARSLAASLHSTIEASIREHAVVYAQEPGGDDSFVTWTGGPKGIGSSKSKVVSREGIQRLVEARDSNDIFIYDHSVFVRQKGDRCVSLNIQGVMFTLLVVFLRYKDIILRIKDLHLVGWRDPDPTAVAPSSHYYDKDIVTQFLKTPISRLRDQIDVRNFKIENVRTVGYSCQGSFSFRVILPAVKLARYLIPNL